MARFTIELPADLADTGSDDRAANRTGRRRGDVDAATRGFVSWVECWAGA
ncbi:MAG: hypothetical protein ABEJ26_13275 [Halosimplex sp.]